MKIMQLKKTEYCLCLKSYLWKVKNELTQTMSEDLP